MVNSQVTISVQDVRAIKYFVQGWIEIKEVIGPECYWSAAGMEIGPKGMFTANSHVAGGWPVKDGDKVADAILEELRPWLEHSSQLENLIGLIEQFYFEGKKFSIRKPKSKLAAVIFKELGIAKSDDNSE